MYFDFEMFGVMKNRFGELIVTDKKLLPRIKYIRYLDAVELYCPGVEYGLMSLGSGEGAGIGKFGLFVGHSAAKDYGGGSRIIIKYENLFYAISSYRSAQKGVRGKENRRGLGGEVFFELGHDLALGCFGGDGRVGGSGGEGVDRIGGNIAELLMFVCDMFHFTPTKLKECRCRAKDGTTVKTLSIKRFAVGGEGDRSGYTSGKQSRVGRGGARTPKRFDVNSDSFVSLPMGYERIEDIEQDLIYDAFYGVADFEKQYKIWCKVHGKRFKVDECWEMYKKIRETKAV